MKEIDYSRYLVSDVQPLTETLEKQWEEQLAKNGATLRYTHLMNVDGTRQPGFFHVDCRWLWSGSSNGSLDAEHVHDFAEVIGFIGSHREDPQDLGGNIEVVLEGEKITLPRSSLIFLPAGTPHGPFKINRVDRPIFALSIAQVSQYSRRSPTAAEKQADPAGPRYRIITETKTRFTVAATGENPPPPIPRDPSLRSTRILHLEDDIVAGSFYLDFVWIWEGNGGAPASEHTHEWVELIAMAGADPTQPHQLGGAMSIDLGGETQYLTRSTLVCIPPGLRHCPWKFIGIHTPTLVFSAGPAGMYSGSHKK